MILVMVAVIIGAFLFGLFGTTWWERRTASQVTPAVGRHCADRLPGVARAGAGLHAGGRHAGRHARRIAELQLWQAEGFKP